MPDTEESKAIVVATPNAEVQRFMPLMSIEVGLERREAIRAAMRSLMKEGMDGDYGKIEGSAKATLLQPGAQKLDNLFGLVPRFEVTQRIEDWTGAEHGGEPFFSYEVRCTLWRGDYLMGEALGEANSWESKWRWRKTERSCPSCGKENIRMSKNTKGEWYCWQKTGGCGATYHAGSPEAKAIEAQEVGRKPNPDIHDLVNTILKIANKRAHVSATINTTSASEFFSPDFGDPDQEMPDYGPPPSQTSAPAEDAPPPPQQSETRPTNKRASKPKGTAYPPGGFPREDAEQAAKPEPQEKPPFPQVGKRPWTNFGEMVRCFDEMLAQMQPYEGPYYHALDKFGVKQAKSFTDPEKAWACYQLLQGLVNERKALENTPDEFDKHMAGEGAPA